MPHLFARGRTSRHHYKQPVLLNPRRLTAALPLAFAAPWCLLIRTQISTMMAIKPNEGFKIAAISIDQGVKVIDAIIIAG
jgi:hypothetical protein